MFFPVAADGAAAAVTTANIRLRPMRGGPQRLVVLGTKVGVMECAGTPLPVATCCSRPQPLEAFEAGSEG